MGDDKRKPEQTTRIVTPEEVRGRGYQPQRPPDVEDVAPESLPAPSGESPIANVQPSSAGDSAGGESDS